MQANGDPGNADAQERRGVLNLRTQRAVTSYANTSAVTTTPEEVVLNFAINVNPPSDQGEINLEVSHRIIMTYPSAKRLAMTLSNVLKRYESRRGPIDVGLRGPEAPAPAEQSEQ